MVLVAVSIAFNLINNNDVALCVQGERLIRCCVAAVVLLIFSLFLKISHTFIYTVCKYQIINFIYLMCVSVLDSPFGQLTIQPKYTQNHSDSFGGLCLIIVVILVSEILFCHTFFYAVLLSTKFSIYLNWWGHQFFFTSIVFLCTLCWLSLSFSQRYYLLWATTSFMFILNAKYIQFL